MGIIKASQSSTCPTMHDLPEEALAQVAAYFQVLSEPTRLKILNLLREGERNVGDIAELTGYTAANVSRHLTQLTKQGFVARESRGTSAYYRIADPRVHQLCELVCGQMAQRFASQAQLLGAVHERPTRRAGRKPS